MPGPYFPDPAAEALRDSAFDSSGFAENIDGNVLEILRYMIANPSGVPIMHPKMIGSVLNHPPNGFNPAGAPASATRTANAGNFYPIYVPKQIALTRLYWQNGSVVNGNIDMGIYDDTDTLLVSSGSTAQAGTDTIQRVTISLTLDPGFYWLALAADNATAQFRHVATQQVRNHSGHFVATSSFPLPSTLPTPTSAAANIILCGAAVDANYPKAID